MDPYEVLNIPRSADQTAIKLAFRKLAKEWHPDRNHQPGAKERFQAIQLAHDQLTGKAKYTPRPTSSRPPRADFHTSPNWDDFLRRATQQPSPSRSTSHTRTSKEQREDDERIARAQQQRKSESEAAQAYAAQLKRDNEAYAAQLKRENEAYAAKLRHY